MVTRGEDSSNKTDGSGVVEEEKSHAVGLA